MGPKRSKGQSAQPAPIVKRLQSHAIRVTAAAETESPRSSSSNEQLPDASFSHVAQLERPTMQQFNELKAQLQLLASSRAPTQQQMPALLPQVCPQAGLQQPGMGSVVGLVPSLAGALQQSRHAPQAESSYASQGESSSFSTLGASLDTRLTAKILSGQFIDLITLQQDEDKVLQFDMETAQWGMGQRTNKKITSIFQWMRLFATYSSIYLAVNPHMGPAFMTYMIRVMDIQKQYPGTDAYLRYDTRFRQLIAKKENVAHLSWEKVEMSIFLDCLQGSSPLPHAAKQPLQGGVSGSRGACYDFNKPGGCKRTHCRYVHKCQHCSIHGHGRSACFKVKDKQPSATGEEARQTESRPATTFSQRR